ncbi:MAG: MBL fold metallo-hydrolase [bacterium]
MEKGEMMQVKTLALGFLEENCYILIDEKTKKAIVIDPGDEEEKILDLLRGENLEVACILLTHGHPDHVGALPALVEATGARVFLHEADISLFHPPYAEKLQGQAFNLGEVEISVLHTPGHTPGSVCFVGPEQVFTGDTLFAGTVGRTDLPGGSGKDISRSLNEKIALLKDDLIVCPGHGPSSTIRSEKIRNPFLRHSLTDSRKDV